MPGTKRSFTYTMIPPSDDVSRVEKQARKVLGWACEGDDRISCHEVTGSALGVVTLSMTIHGRDRWWTTQLAQDVLDIVLWGLRTNATRLQLQSRKLEAHTHRGYAHGRTKRHRASAPGSSTAGGASSSSAMSSGAASTV